MASAQSSHPIFIDRKPITSAHPLPAPAAPKFESPAALIQPVADGAPIQAALAGPAVTSRLLEQGAPGLPDGAPATVSGVLPCAKVMRKTAGYPLAWIVAAILAVTLGGLMVANFRESTPRHQHIRFQIKQPEGQLGPFQLSPDGRFLALTTLEETTKFWVRPLDAVDTRLVAAVPFDVDGFAMFWS